MDNSMFQQIETLKEQLEALQDQQPIPDETYAALERAIGELEEAEHHLHQK